MTPDDPRHGGRAGYIAGCRCTRCGHAHYRYQKRSRLRLLTEGPQAVPAHTLIARLAWWDARGVATSAVADAARLGEGTLKELVSGERDVCLRSTLRAGLAVTWDDIGDRALCGADMTRRRVYSMMASGHSLAWITDQVDGLPLSGRWRVQKKVYVGTARGVARLAATAPAVGSSPHSATKARGKGHLPLMGWDDPGHPAMPAGWEPDLPQSDDPTDVLIEQYLAGDFTTKAPAELRSAICAAWVQDGRVLQDLARATGWAIHRYYRVRDHQQEEEVA